MCMYVHVFVCTGVCVCAWVCEILCVLVCVRDSLHILVCVCVHVIVCEMHLKLDSISLYVDVLMPVYVSRNSFANSEANTVPNSMVVLFFLSFFWFLPSE